MADISAAFCSASPTWIGCTLPEDLVIGFHDREVRRNLEKLPDREGPVVTAPWRGGPAA
jgi:hypothetical protein